MQGLEMVGAIIVAITVGVVVVSLVLYLRIMSRRHYKCPYCGERFKANALRTFFTFDSRIHKEMYCPACGKYGAMQFQHDDEIDPEADAAEQKDLRAKMEQQEQAEDEAEGTASKEPLDTEQK